MIQEINKLINKIKNPVHSQDELSGDYISDGQMLDEVYDKLCEIKEKNPPTYVDNSRWIELISGLATEVVEAKYGEHTWEHVEGGGFIFQEEAQDDFNEFYDLFESMIRVTLNVRSDAELKTSDE